MSPHDLIGNASYVLLAVSYMVTNIYWLRLLAIIALTAEAVYFSMAGDSALWVGILWAGIFNAINIVQLARLARTRFRIRMSEEERLLHASIFGRLEKHDFSRILGAGRFVELAAGTTLTREDGPVENLHLMLSGRARVMVDGRLIAVIGTGDFIGEMAFIGACGASATVITDSRCRTFRIAHDELRALCAKHEKIEAAMNARFSIDLAHKLRTRPLKDQPLKDPLAAETGLRGAARKAAGRAMKAESDSEFA